jgi:hypothetical protein
MILFKLAMGFGRLLGSREVLTMQDEKRNKAKEIFLHYGGSYFHMAREEVLNDYLKYSISKRQELEWIKEYQQELIADIEKENVVGPSLMRLEDTICGYRDIEGLKSVLELINRKKGKADSFTQLLMAELLIRIYDSFRQCNVLSDPELSKLRKLAIAILEVVMAGPITVSEYYLDSSLMIEATRDYAVIKRARQDLEEIMRK